MILRRYTLCLAVVLLLPAARCRAQAQRDKLPTVSLQAAVGYFRHDTRWSIAGDAQGANPNIYSELIWKNLRGPAVVTTATWNTGKHWSLQGQFTKADIIAGHVTDTDYASDNRTNPRYTGTYTSNDGNITTWNLSLGYHLHLAPSLTLTLSGGYGEHHQSLYILANYIPTPLRSTYTTTARGPLLTAETHLRLTQHVTIITTVSAYQLRYTAEADWNLSAALQHPVSFEHTANGYALQLSLQPHYHVTHRLSLFLRADYRRQQTGKGNDTLYLANGQQTSTRFNGARSTLLTLGLGIGYRW
jgi:outer membrane protease